MQPDLFSSGSFPRSSKYHPDWIKSSVSGGANPLWLTEWLTNDMTLKPGMRVLDLGCGRAMSSIFMHREFGVEVWAVDLLIPLLKMQNVYAMPEPGNTFSHSMPMHVIFRLRLVFLMPLLVLIHFFIMAQMIYIFLQYCVILNLEDTLLLLVPVQL